MNLTVEGRSVYAYTGGRKHDEVAPTIVFVHGAQHDHSVWALQSRWLAHHGYRVIVPDLPGHGRSAGPACTSVEGAARWLIALLDAAEVRQAALVGHSFGSLIALEAASMHPERVTKLGLIGTAFPMTVSDALMSAARDDEPRAIEMINARSHSVWAPKPSAPGPGFWLRGMNQRLMERQRPGVLATDLAACHAYEGGAAAAANIACPTLVVIGANDAMAPAKSARMLAAKIADCNVQTIARCGHAVCAEAPDAVLEALAAFL